MTFEPPLRWLNGANQARLRPLPSGTMPQPLRQSDRREPEMIEPPPRWLSGKSQARLRPSSSETVPQLRQHIDRHAPEQTPEPPPRGLKHKSPAWPWPLPHVMTPPPLRQSDALPQLQWQGAKIRAAEMPRPRRKKFLLHVEVCPWSSPVPELSGSRFCIRALRRLWQRTPGSA